MFCDKIADNLAFALLQTNALRTPCYCFNLNKIMNRRDDCWRDLHSCPAVVEQVNILCRLNSISCSMIIKCCFLEALTVQKILDKWLAFGSWNAYSHRWIYSNSETNARYFVARLIMNYNVYIQEANYSMRVSCVTKDKNTLEQEIGFRKVKNWVPRQPSPGFWSLGTEQIYFHVSVA